MFSVTSSYVIHCPIEIANLTVRTFFVPIFSLQLRQSTWTVSIVLYFLPALHFGEDLKFGNSHQLVLSLLFGDWRDHHPLSLGSVFYYDRSLLCYANAFQDSKTDHKRKQNLYFIPLSLLDKLVKMKTPC